MALAPGTRLGPYEVESILGAGGMGEVYRARDVRLGRCVALKVLPAEVEGDRDRIERFEREARAIAALNHPNICALYDVGDQVGRAYLVMELLEGETLQQRLTRGAMDTATILDTAIPLADALDAAHVHGLIHRDLKPGNIFITRRGQPKILDFGLARALYSASDQTRAATDPLTGAGVAVGTVEYMSPEQLRGETVDARSDLFSLGIVLYEMATGRRPFGGATSAAVSGAILHETPAPPHTIAPVPDRLEETILKALEKDRDLRCQSAAELRADLKRAKRASDAGAAVPTQSTHPTASSATAHVAVAPPASSDTQVAVTLARRHPMTVASGIVAIAALVGAGFWVARRDSPPSGSSTAAPAIEIQAITDIGDTGLGALSPDGHFVAIIRNIFHSSVWVRQLTARSDVEIVPPLSGRRYIALSVTPDGSFVDCVAVEPGLRAPMLFRVPFLGGAAKRIASDVWSGTGWSPDGSRFAFIRAHGADAEDQLVVMDADGTNERVLATRHFPKRFQSDSQNTSAIARPTWSPDGHQLLAIGRVGGDAPVVQLVVIDAATGTERATIPMPFQMLDAAWMDNNHALVNAYTQERPPGLMLVDLRDGSNRRLTPNVAVFLGVSNTPDRKTAVSTQVASRSTIWMGDGSGQNLVEAVPESSTWVFGLQVSNAGTIAYTTGSVTGGFSSYVSTADARVPRPVLTSADHPRFISPDGRTLIFVRSDNEGGIYSASVDRSGATKLVEGRADAGSLVVTPDGKTLLFTSRTREGMQSLWAASAAGGPPREIAHRFVGSGSITVSPDSRRVLFSTSRPTPTSRTPMMVCDLPDCTNQHEVPWHGGLWTPDGKGIAYVDPAADPTNITVAPIDGSPPHPLTHFSGSQPIDDFAWSTDGTKLAIARSTKTADIVLIKGLSGVR